jgi:hypothetical protein
MWLLNEYSQFCVPAFKLLISVLKLFAPFLFRWEIMIRRGVETRCWEAGRLFSQVVISELNYEFRLPGFCGRVDDIVVVDEKTAPFSGVG